MSDRPATTWRLTGFGDEIDPEPALQLAVLQSVGAECIEVRSAWGVNVVDFERAQVDALGEAIHSRGMSVSAIASPIGKVSVDLPVEHEVDRLAKAISVAHRLDAPYVRIFSFYRAAAQSPAAVRDAVLERMSALARLAEREGVTLVHENEKEIYGDVPERVLDLIESVGSERLRVAWDNANFVQVGVRPYTDGYALLRPYLEYLQIKDALAATGEVVPAGEGDGELFETLTALRDDGYRGFASLEPHLVVAGHSSGYSGPAGFGRAARAFRALTERIGVGLR